MSQREAQADRLRELGFEEDYIEKMLSDFHEPDDDVDDESLPTRRYEIVAAGDGNGTQTQEIQ